MIFDTATITEDGFKLFTEAVAGEKIVWGTCICSIDDAGTQPVAKGNAVSAYKSASTDIAYISCSMSNMEDGCVEGPANYFMLYAKKEGDAAEKIVIRASVGEHAATTFPEYDPDYPEKTSLRGIVDFNVQLSQGVISTIDMTIAAYALASDLQALSERVVTTHSIDSESTGDAQIVYGKKSFMDGLSSTGDRFTATGGGDEGPESSFVIDDNGLSMAIDFLNGSHQLSLNENGITVVIDDNEHFTIYGDIYARGTNASFFYHSFRAVCTGDNGEASIEAKQDSSSISYQGEFGENHVFVSASGVDIYADSGKAIEIDGTIKFTGSVQEIRFNNEGNVYGDVTLNGSTYVNGSVIANGQIYADVIDSGSLSTTYLLVTGEIECESISGVVKSLASSSSSSLPSVGSIFFILITSISSNHEGFSPKKAGETISLSDIRSGIKICLAKATRGRTLNAQPVFELCTATDSRSITLGTAVLKTLVDLEEIHSGEYCNMVVPVIRVS